MGMALDMTKKEMVEEIMLNSSISDNQRARFYAHLDKNLNRQTKGWIERCYGFVMNSENESKKKLNADFVMQWFR